MVNQRISLRDVDISLKGKIVCSAEKVTMDISRELTPVGEGGTHKTVEIVEGMETIEGEATGVNNIDSELLNELHPNKMVSPEFTLSGRIDHDNESGGTMKVSGVKFTGIIQITEGPLYFKAVDYSVD